jgi:hypothetical protein
MPELGSDLTRDCCPSCAVARKKMFQQASSRKFSIDSIMDLREQSTDAARADAGTDKEPSGGSRFSALLKSRAMNEKKTASHL